MNLNEAQNTGNYQAEHLAEFQASGLSNETIEADGYSSATAEQVDRVLGWAAGAGWLVEYPGAANADGTPYIRVRPDKSPMIDGKEAKYLTPKGAGNRLFIPTKTRPVLDDPTIPLFVTEGEKKASKATQEGFLCVGLSGVWNFRERYLDNSGKRRKRLLPELKDIEWDGRLTYIVFDSDALHNPNVLQAESILAGVLKKLGADVRIVRLPEAIHGD